MNPENHLNDDDYWNVISDQEAQYQSSVMGDDDLFRLTRQTFKDLDDEINSNLDKEYGQGGTDDGWCDLSVKQMEQSLTDTTDKTLKILMKGFG
ncbi:MAG: hypothetical protein IAA89_06145 [Firmicutes bacterium]|uniref:Uncharacterized protein n=1 Tax=Candidatus Gallilactobacillus intestinavium TaxID=2840838 RepID=A0A9D9E616_9LACO|nr:hypothetical protein [Candidatus Gallilactobacillus intestinavium]